MGTVVTIEVVGHGTSQRARRARDLAITHAMEWFRRVEESCSRFDANSELRQLSTRIGVPVVVSPLLCEAVRFALQVARETGGVFDPTVGHRMEARGFDRAYQTGAHVSSAVPAPDDVSYRDVGIDTATRSVTLRRPLLLDLGAVAKGLAVDMAAKTLAPLVDFVVDAGGDLYAGGTRTNGAPWEIGIRDPLNTAICAETLAVTNMAVCTSGSYARRADNGSHASHLLNAISGASRNDVASVTVLAPSAMVADAMATAAYLLGPQDGLTFLAAHKVEGVLFTATRERLTTPGAVYV